MTMQHPGSIAEGWAVFQRTVLPKNAPLIQVVETRRGYYAGAIQMFDLVTGFGDYPDDDDAAMMDRVKQLDAVRVEIESYIADLAAGRV